jgi:hypothetical protein
MGFVATNGRTRRAIIGQLDLLPAENYRRTLAAGVADFPVGDAFCSDETGELRRYERIAAAPGYSDLGDQAAPANRAMVDASRLDVPQNLTAQKKAVARANIGAPEYIAPRALAFPTPTVSELYAVSGDTLTIDTGVNGFARVYLPLDGGELSILVTGTGSVSLNGSGLSLSGVPAAGVILGGSPQMQLYADATTWNAVQTDTRSIAGLDAELSAANRRERASRRSVALVRAGSAARRAKFGTAPVYRMAGAETDQLKVVDNGAGAAPAFDAAGQLIVERPTKQLLANPAFAGFNLGRVGAGFPGSFGSGWANGVGGNAFTEIVSAVGGRLRLRQSSVVDNNNVALNPTTPTHGFTSAWTAIGPLARGGVVDAAILRIVAASGSFQRVYVAIQTRNSATGLTADSYAGSTVSIIGVDAISSAFTTIIPAGHDQFRFRVVVYLSSLTPFSVEFETAEPRAEDGKSAQDYTSYTAGQRTGGARILLPAVDHDIFIGGAGGCGWLSGNGDTPLVSDTGTLRLSNLAAIERMAGPLTIDEKNDFAQASFPPVLGVAIGNDQRFSLAGRTWNTQNAGKAWSLAAATNRRNMMTFETRAGDHANGEVGKTRSEVLPASSDPMFQVPFDTPYWMSGHLAIQSDVINPENIQSLIGQIHANGDMGDVSTSPLFGMRAVGRDLLITTQGDVNAVTSGNSVQQRAFLFRNVLRTGLSEEMAFHRWVACLKTSRTGNASLDFWWNGEHYTRTGLLMGYNDVIGGYPKFGIYEPTESGNTIRVTHAMLELSLTSLFDRVANPLPIV